jgi:hypothetical protein
MNSKLTSNVPLSQKMLATVALLALTLIPSLAAQDEHENTCGGLHAAISGAVVRRDPLATQSPYVMLTFVGKELKGSGLIFGNGLRPVGGWGF